MAPINNFWIRCALCRHYFRWYDVSPSKAYIKQVLWLYGPDLRYDVLLHFHSLVDLPACRSIQSRGWGLFRTLYDTTGLGLWQSACRSGAPLIKTSYWSVVCQCRHIYFINLLQFMLDMQRDDQYWRPLKIDYFIMFIYIFNKKNFIYWIVFVFVIWGLHNTDVN